MSDPKDNLEFIFKNQYSKQRKSLYSANKQQNKHTIKPRDVLKSVSLQLKAIQVADSMKSGKCIEKDLHRYKKSNFLSVNKLPVYEEVPKQANKFDTQCVSDTQLINIIEDAEMIDVHKGMTQEFESTFCYHTEKYNIEEDEKEHLENSKKILDNINLTSSEGIVRNEDNNARNPSNNKREATRDNILVSNTQNVAIDSSFDILSSIPCNEIIDYETSINSQHSKKEEYSQVEEFSPILNQCMDIEDETDSVMDKPLSPIFVHKNVKMKSKSPSPLIFNLDRFEQFEKMAIPILEVNDLKTAKQVINSQILDKELHIKIDEEILLNENEDILSPIIQNKGVKKILSPILENKTEPKANLVKYQGLNRNLEFIELDKATFESLNKIIIENTKENKTVKVKGENHSEILKDEILFSSDEEDNYVHKDCQDLPFTCALETSFYNQSDVLDKTMYVGFQTASNKTIQICTDSFAQAKSLLNDVIDNQITVTDLVKKCDSSVKNKSQIVNNDQVKRDTGCVDIELDLAQNDIQKSEFNLDISNSVENLRDILNTNNDNPHEKSKFGGFMTASKKQIILSNIALARCKKVFQDIDLNENFNTKIADGKVLTVVSEEKKLSTTTDISKIGINKLANEDVQNIDNLIMQEFENIEMSLDENEKVYKNDVATIGFKIASDKDIKVSETTLSKMKDLFNDIDFDENDIRENDVEENIDNSILKKNKRDPSLRGFKTASNKNINISKEALAKTKNLFQDIESIELPNKFCKELVEPKKNKGRDKINYYEQPSTSKGSLIAFETANNNSKQISRPALANTKNIFKEIDSIDFEIPKMMNKDLKKDNNTSEEQVDRQPFISKTSLEGFKTANNRAINITKEALTKTRDIFQDIDSLDFQFPIKRRDLRCDDFPGCNQPSTSKAAFVGFKTASNKNIQISDAALVKTKNIFKDIDAIDIESPVKGDKKVEKIDERMKKDNKKIVDKADFIQASVTNSQCGFITANNKEIEISDTDSNDLGFLTELNKENAFVEMRTDNPDTYKGESDDLDLPTTRKASFSGFKTANNRNINISKQALIKSKNMFKDIESMDFSFPDKVSNKQLEKVNITQKKYNSYESKTIDNQPSTSKGVFIGFKTANNKKINISEDSLTKTKSIFKDIDSNDFKFPQKLNTNQQETARKENSNYEISEFDFNQPSISVTNFAGFKTANNKVINISETSLAKTKHMFKNLDIIDFIDPNNCKEDYPNVGENYRETYKRTENNDIKNDLTVIRVPAFKGFQTANNKQVEISTDALIKSRKIFQEINDDFNKKNKIIEETCRKSLNINKNLTDNVSSSEGHGLQLDGKSSPIFKGFQTANKKPVNISEEALANSKKLFQDIDLSDEEIPEPVFRGFKTANNKSVDVSQRALLDTKKLFDADEKRLHESDKEVVFPDDSNVESRKIFQGLEIENRYNPNDNLKHDVEKVSSIDFDFKTGTNRNVIVSEKALLRSKRLFSGIDDSDMKPPNHKREKVTEEANIDMIIDTQVLNNFDESLHTEDFHNTQINSKRSGSPILICPRAKKRKKFETPYNTQKIQKPRLKQDIITKNQNKIAFNDNYKKTRKYSLRELTRYAKDSVEIDPYLLKFNFGNLLEFEFLDDRNDLSSNNITLGSLKELFLNSVNGKLVPNGWLDNHLKLVLWKLISYEITFNSSIVCTARNVMNQLKYRYDRELYNAQRPALRKILEKDDVASKTMVLCVAGLFVDGVSVASVTGTDNLELLLTDGWYCIRTCIDKMLAQLVCNGRIVVGTKIVINGAELVNCEQGISPWEDTTAVRLKIFGNSTRRARWDARLGYHSNAAILSQLSSVKLDGGKVSKLRVFVTRVYPALYVEKFEDGSTVTRSERLEHLHQMKTEAERQSIMEKIYEEVEKEFSDQESQDSEGYSDSSGRRTSLDSGSQIAKLMKRSKDPAEFRAGLTSSQSRLLEAHTSKRRELLLQDIQKRIREKMEKAGVSLNRNVVTLLKTRVAGVVEKKNGVEVTKGMMSIWKPNDAMMEIIKEGSWIDVINVVPTAIRYSEIQISAGRQSVFSISKYKEPEKFKPYTELMKRTCFTIKYLSQNSSMSSDYSEIDTAGLIFLIDPSLKDFDSTKQSFQNIYLADSDKNIICVNFWGGLKKFGFESVLDTGQLVACANLQKRAGNTRKAIPQYRVTEFSYFTKTPKNVNARNLIDDLSKKFLSLDRRKFCEDCVLLKNNYSVIKNNNENISPYRFNNSNYNTSKNKMFIDSPLEKPNEIKDNFNLTGLDFESTFKETGSPNLTEEALLRKKKVNEKIAKLKMYGEPPPLSSIQLINRSKNASSSYKSPLLANNGNSRNTIPKSNSESTKALLSESDSSVNVASINKKRDTPEKQEILNESTLCSPVLLNRTYVKIVNPVKINFDVKDNNDSNIDHFAEDFDGSPPLSLD